MNKMRPLRRWLPLWLFVLLAFAPGTQAAEVIPPKPDRYFNDSAQMVGTATRERLNSELETLEEQSSNQILVCIYPKMQTDSSIEDYCHRIYAGWGVGQKGKNNGAVLFVFKDDHQQRIEVGRGLEGVLPDSVCKDILDDTMAPKFQAGDFDGGLTAGVEAMISASKGEYKGNGRTAYQDSHRDAGGIGAGGMLLIFLGGGIFLVLCIFVPGFFGGFFNVLGFLINILSMFSGGDDRGGGSSSGGGGGGWSSGGGDSGAGGGASGSW